MSEKPGLFRRLKKAIQSTLNDAVEAVSDPGQEVALMLDDLAENIRKSELDLKQAIVDQKMMEKKLEQLARDETAWQRRAEQAITIGDETLARAALQRKGEITQEREATDEALVQQRKLVEDLRQGITDAKSKLKALNLRRGTLMAQARAHKQSGGTSTIPGDAGAGARMDAIESKIARLEALNEVSAEDMDGRIQEAQIDAQLNGLSAKNDLDDALAALKAKMQAKQLEEGKK
ncbi:PspA/IM30 family protein [Nannocystis pusilla]|uniref:PspA/IM30 family protein n=1 Tax=Nannocystis pusilla TaxID=889268 RepID=A0ABS7TWE7_9BACT|nr:PspA/IM30 family protein [Nannocystis pusilla]MBZ5712351.1 PspA/IM30 family protein [Nannocystis pusilla]